MATLKILTDVGNYIWLTGVKRVEEMFYMQYPLEGMYHTPLSDSIYDFMYAELNFLSDGNLKSYSQERLQGDTFTAVVEKPQAGVKYKVLHVITFDERDDQVRTQNWIVQAGQNFLMDNGKTIDRL
jgi:hypothetical protein